VLRRLNMAPRPFCERELTASDSLPLLLMMIPR
jgi:hypothetical protein